MRPVILFSVLLAVSLTPFSTCLELKELFSWKTLNFTFKNSHERRSFVKDGLFIPENNVPNSIAVWKDRIFFAIPRTKPGVPYTLCYLKKFDIHMQSSSPLLTPYPDGRMHTEWIKWTSGDSSHSKSKSGASSHLCHSPPCNGIGNNPDDHEQPYQGHVKRHRRRRDLQSPAKSDQLGDKKKSPLMLVSVYSIKVDKCNRLWVLDSGVVEGKRFVAPQVFFFNLHTNEPSVPFQLDRHLYSEESLFANIYVDVHANDCEKTYIYMPDMSHSLVVFDVLRRKAWKVQQRFFHMDSSRVDVTAGDGHHQLEYGIYGMALSNSSGPGSFKDVYFHPMASTNLYKVSTKTLQNSMEGIKSTDDKYMKIGSKDARGETGASLIKNNVMFYTQINKNSVNCWNIQKPFQVKKNQVTVVRSTSTIPLVYPTDLTLDHHSHLWILSTYVPVFVNEAVIDVNRTNIRVFVGSTEKLIRGTACSASERLLGALIPLVLGGVSVWLTK